MRKIIVYWLITIIFFIIYLKIEFFVWNKWVPFNVITNILSLSIIFIVIIPLSAISSHLTLKMIRQIK